jgi:type II secretory pathway pseudopilin PulG
MTLIEMALASTLLVIVGSTAILAARSTTQAYRTETANAELERVGRQALREIESALRSADADAVIPPAVQPPLSTSTVSFARCTGYANGKAAFGPTERFVLEPDPLDPDDGLDNDGDGTIDEGRLVWIENPGPNEVRHVLASWVAEYAEREVPGNGIDDNANGLVDERGFSITFQESLATLRLTLVRRDQVGYLLQHEITRSIELRNTGVTP